MKKIFAFLALLLCGMSVDAQTFQVNHLQVNSAFTAPGLVGLPNLAVQAANSVVANVTASSGIPTAATVPSCSGSSNALQWTAGAGFSCNGSIAASSVTGTVGVANGGTGQVGPWGNGSVILGNGSGALSQALQGAANTALLSTGTSSAPSFQQITAPIVNFTTPYTSGVTRTLSARLADMVNVKDFGATGNGASNDTAAFQAAENAACTFPSSNGATVYIPSGAYLVNTGSFVAGCNGLHWQGAGVQNTIILTNSTSGDMFDFNTITGGGVHDLYIDFNNTPTSGIAIESNGAYNLTVDNVRITGAFEAIGILGLGVPQFYNNLDIEGTQTGGTGIYINGGSDQYFNNVLVYSPSTTPAAGVHIQNSGGVFINGMDVVHVQTGLLIDPPNGSSVDWLSVMNADFDSNTQHGVYFNPATGGSVYGSNFVNTWSSSNTNIGVYISSAGGTVSGLRFVGHRGLNNGQDGMVINPSSGTVTNIQVSDSDFSGNSQSSSGTYNGITIGAGVSGFMINGCRSGVYANYANTQKYGILVNAGASNNYIITNNNAQSNVTGDVQDNGTGGTKIVANNL